ncbi:MAG: PA0069 family radical SAM protein [Planctomycetota bacterium]
MGDSGGPSRFTPPTGTPLAPGTPGTPVPRGRGAATNPANRFARIDFAEDLEYLESDPEAAEARRGIATEYFADDAKSVISENDSPDIPFRYSLNPYRGCAHGCSYCFARPTHEYLDLSAGLDFETRIFVKERAPELFREWLGRDGYRPETVAMSGVTDCYQPIERKLQLTRRCVEVAVEARQPLAVVTKNALVTRDIDLLAPLAAEGAASVSVSVTTLDQSLSRVMEPRTSSPEAKLRAIGELSRAGIPVSVLVAPIVPGLTDHEIPRILQSVKEAGAISVGYILLRLPLTVEPVFMEWLHRVRPSEASKVETRIRATRGGKLYDSRFGERMRGSGPIADQINASFRLFAARYGLSTTRPPLTSNRFRRPVPRSGQRWLFD